jgi:hypothetical protein
LMNTRFGYSSGHLSSQTHWNVGHPFSLSVPHSRSWHLSSHIGDGRGLQIVDLQPHASVVSTIISHGRQTATLIAGHSFLTHSFSHGQQHSRPSSRLTVRSTWHLSHSGSGIFGHVNSFSVQHLHGKHSWFKSHTPFILEVLRYSPFPHFLGGGGNGITVSSMTHWLNLNTHSCVRQQL